MNFSKDFKFLQGLAKTCVDEHGKVTDSLQKVIYSFEIEHGSYMSDQQKKALQTLISNVGGKSTLPIHMPENDTPYWLQDAGKFRTFRSNESIPDQTDILVIGAGLAGSSAAYHISKTEEFSCVVLDAEFPGAQASGRNGGNFQSVSESHNGCYDGIQEERRQWLKLRFPNLSEAQLQKRSRKESLCIYNFTRKNTELMDDVIFREKIHCDYCNKGWLRVAGSELERNSLKKDHDIFATGDNPMHEWSSSKIRSKLGLSNQHSGRLIKHSGNYHPFKFLRGLLEKAIEKGVKLYTQMKVLSIQPEKGGKMRVDVKDVRNETMHSIICARVVVATNAFTPSIFPQLKEDIECYTSQIANWEHVKNNIRGLTITEHEGDIYYNFPKSKRYLSRKQPMGMLHFGLDDGRISDPHKYERREDHLQKMVKMVNERFKDTKRQPPSRCWAGPIAITIDRTPMIGFYDCSSGAKDNTNVSSKVNTGVVLAVAFQGFGGSFCFHAGYAAAYMALTGLNHPDVPPEIFSPHRFDEMSKEEKSILNDKVNKLGYSCYIHR